MAETEFVNLHFPYLSLTVTLGQQTIRVEALLDTGFDGDIVLPSSLITEYRVPDEYRGWGLADSSEVITPVYHGSVQLGDFPPMPVDIVVLADEPIVGRGITDRYRVILDRGARVIVQP